MPPFVHAYMSSWVYAHPCTAVRVAVLTRKSVGYIENHGRFGMEPPINRGGAGSRCKRTRATPGIRMSRGLHLLSGGNHTAIP
jgi:hypothetical protein